MKLLAIIVLTFHFLSTPASALTERAKRVLGISTDGPKDYLVVACTYLDVANHLKPLKRVMLLKQKPDSVEMYPGSNLLKKESFAGAKIVHFETKEFHGQTNFEGLSDSARNELFKRSWKNAQKKKDAELDLNSLGQFTFNFNSRKSADYTRLVFTLTSPEDAMFKKGYTGRHVFLKCEYFAIPLDDSKAKTPAVNSEECIVGPTDPNCEPLPIDSDS